MRARRLLAAIFLAAAAFAAAPEVSAQSIPSPYRHIEPPHALSVFSGYLHTDGGDRGIGVASGTPFGLQYTGRFAGPVAGVVRVWGMPTDRTVLARADAEDPGSEIIEVDEASAILAAGEVGLRLLVAGPRTWHSLAPFVELTGGMFAVAGSRTTTESNLPENQVVDYGPAFAVGTAVGTDWFLTDRISVNLSGRGLLWRLTTPEGLTEDGREASEWTRNFGVSIGGAFHF